MSAHLVFSARTRYISLLGRSLPSILGAKGRLFRGIRKGTHDHAYTKLRHRLQNYSRPSVTCALVAKCHDLFDSSMLRLDHTRMKTRLKATIASIISVLVDNSTVVSSYVHDTSY